MPCGRCDYDFNNVECGYGNENCVSLGIDRR
nr:hypothetical protein Iba_chr09fCG4580 [Ipomoea batatas]